MARKHNHDEKEMKASPATKERTGDRAAGGGRPGPREQHRTGHHPTPSNQRHPASPLHEQKQPRPGIEANLQHKPQYQAPAYRAAGKLEGKVAIVTGGDSGIGRAIAVLYAREGADVAIMYLPDEQVDADETRHAVEAEGRRCLTIPGDVRDSNFCRAAVERTVRQFGRLDILVNNAAYQHHQKSLADISDDQLEQTFHTNIFGYF